MNKEQPSELSQCCERCKGFSSSQFNDGEIKTKLYCENTDCPCHIPRQTTQPLSKSTQKKDNLPISRQEKPSDATVTCLSINCPERTGGKCNVLERMEVANKEPWWSEEWEKLCEYRNTHDGTPHAYISPRTRDTLKTFISSIEQKTKKEAKEYGHEQYALGQAEGMAYGRKSVIDEAIKKVEELTIASKEKYQSGLCSHIDGVLQALKELKQ